MGKRRNDNLRSPQEIRQDSERNYDKYIRDEQKKPRINPVPEKRSTTPVEQSDLILRDPGAMDARRCYECECTGVNGACSNFLLYAYLRQMCRLPAGVTG